MALQKLCSKKDMFIKIVHLDLKVLGQPRYNNQLHLTFLKMYYFLFEIPVLTWH